MDRLLRGCYVFENLVYLELRYNPYFRVPAAERESGDMREAMARVVATIAAAGRASFRERPVVLAQILCIDSRLPSETNRAILETAFAMRPEVCALDLAGPDELYAERRKELSGLLLEAKGGGLKVTAHAYETPAGALPEVLEFADRIGHGIQIPLRAPHLLKRLAERKVCLEICPTTYLRAGTLKSYAELLPVFRGCFDAGVPVAVCTDNSALHGVRLPQEFERLLLHGVIGWKEMEHCREVAFRHAFAWPGTIDRPDRSESL